MHELSLCEGVLQSIQIAAEEEHFSRVRGVWLEIGVLSCVEPDAMRFAFDAVMKTTLAEGATLNIITIPGQGWCSHCEKQVEVIERYDACPNCQHHPLQISAGDRMQIKQLEVE